MVTAMQLPDFRQVVLKLLGFERGSARFVIGEDDELVYQETVATVQMNRGETIEAFHKRIRQEHQLRKGDTIEILNNNGKVNTARITMRR